MTQQPLTLAGRIPAFDLSDRLKKAREVSGLDQEQMDRPTGTQPAVHRQRPTERKPILWGDQT